MGGEVRQAGALELSHALEPMLTHEFLHALSTQLHYIEKTDTS